LAAGTDDLERGGRGCNKHGLTREERAELQQELEERARMGEGAQGYQDIEDVARELKLGDFAPSEPSAGEPLAGPR